MPWILTAACADQFEPFATFFPTFSCLSQIGCRKRSQDADKRIKTVLPFTMYYTYCTVYFRIDRICRMILIWICVWNCTFLFVSLDRWCLFDVVSTTFYLLEHSTLTQSSCHLLHVNVQFPSFHLVPFVSCSDTCVRS
jgi:hypothetical protein